MAYEYYSEEIDESELPLSFRTRLAILLTLISLFLVFLGAFLTHKISNDTSFPEIMRKIPYYVIGLVTLIMPLIAWPLALIKSNKSTKRTFILTLVSACLITLSYFITNDYFTFGEDKLALFIIVNIIGMYGAIFGWGFYLYESFNKRPNYHLVTMIIICIFIFNAELFICNGFNSLFSGADKLMHGKFTYDFLTISIFVPISSIIYSFAIRIRDLSDKHFILMFALGPLNALMLPIVIFFKAAKIMFTVSSTSVDYETVEYLVDENGNREEVDSHSGNSVHTSSGWHDMNDDGTYR